MCKAYVLRFSCSHGVLMGFEPCNMGPCPVLKLSGSRLPQQPYRCYNCQHRLERTSVSSSTGSSRTSSQESLNSSMSGSSLPPIAEIPSRKISLPIHPLPGVAVQPTGCTRMRNKSSPARPFSFSCNGSSHFATPHYAGLPGHLPHQDHSCPPCQLEELRQKADVEVMRTAKASYPNLRAEMLVRDGRIQEWKNKPTLDKYIEEKRTEERELWVHVSRKWTQDLRKSRVLVAEEDGLGLLG